MSLVAEVSLCNPAPLHHRPDARGAASREPLHLTRSPAMKDLYRQIEKVAGVDVPVLFLGESGVGKEFFAKQLHQLSPRSRKPFLKVNCAALPSELLESELFGYEAGAFTGATRTKPGQFELCDEGTILLDEIAEMSPAMQAKLLHILQDQRFSRLGGRRMIQGNFRVLAATNVDIDDALAQKRFRADLYYRLNTIILHIPPLRDRREDIPLFLDHFLAETAALFGIAPRPVPARLWEACLQYPWPGNIRELQSFTCRFLLLNEDEALIAELTESASSENFAAESREENSSVNLGLKSLGRKIRARAEKQMIEDALLKTYWNRSEAARLLKISYKSLRNKIRLYGISAIPCPSQPDQLVETNPILSRGPNAFSADPARKPARPAVPDSTGELAHGVSGRRYISVSG